MKKEKGFTLIELMIIIAIIGLLTAIILALWASSAQNKAAINGYKTSMDSVRTAVEMCIGSGGTAGSGAPGTGIICNSGSEKYPTLSAKCGSITQFVIGSDYSGWAVTTNNNCRDCRLICNVEKCYAASGTECD
ncbi:MAG: prepilin-type N-terminal cleavage/methylation domain-containing protein [Candidatus Moranbacteria bacterium]|nr:prepilin-type N-terminal cleavage/methylation domain-containing protein [Candidatus Moranbacteria bacterium]